LISLAIKDKQGNKPHKEKKTKEYLSDFLSYRDVTADNIFENESTYGFVLKLTPFSGFDEK
jgi:hypothetical protein